MYDLNAVCAFWRDNIHGAVVVKWHVPGDCVCVCVLESGFGY